MAVALVRHLVLRVAATVAVDIGRGEPQWRRRYHIVHLMAHESWGLGHCSMRDRRLRIMRGTERRAKRRSAPHRPRRRPPQPRLRWRQNECAAAPTRRVRSKQKFPHASAVGSRAPPVIHAAAAAIPPWRVRGLKRLPRAENPLIDSSTTCSCPSAASYELAPRARRVQTARAAAPSSQCSPLSPA